MTQTEIGRRLGVQKRAVSRWERNQIPKPERFRALVALFYQLDPQGAQELAASNGSSLLDLGLVAAPNVIEVAARNADLAVRAAVESAIFAAAQSLDASPRALTPAFAAALARLRDYGVSLDAALTVLAQTAPT